jgi:hypothetical protein
MIDMKSHAYARIRWYKEKEGGRKSLPSGPILAANLRFENEENLWSVVLLLQDSKPDDMGFQDVGLGFLFRDQIGGHLQVGKHIFVYEGPVKIIAEGYVTSITKR